MRKKPFWKKQVYAGEYTVEFTRGKNGLHIHIHALLLVKKEFQNRNRLYRNLFKAWNQQTTSEDANRQEFSQDQKKGIAKALGMTVGSEYFEAFFAKLHPSGSTLCSLESLYVVKDGKKRYVKKGDEKDFMAGIMECLKYHFEPCKIKNEEDGSHFSGGVFKKDSGQFNVELLFEVLPAIYKQRLYAKIGAFYGDPRLNMNQLDSLSRLMETYKKQFTGYYSFNGSTLEVLPSKKGKEYVLEEGANVGLQIFQRALSKRKIKGYDSAVEDFIEDTPFGLLANWEQLPKPEFRGICIGFRDYLREKFEDKETENKEVVKAFQDSFGIDYIFHGIQGLRMSFKALFGQYYIKYAAEAREVLTDFGIRRNGDLVSEKLFKMSVSRLREKLKERLEEIDRIEAAKDNAVNEGVFHPETLAPTLLNDYCYKIRDIATVFVRKHSKDADYGKMQALSEPKFPSLVFHGKLGAVLKSFSQLIANEVKETSMENKMSRNTLQEKRIKKASYDQMAIEKHDLHQAIKENRMTEIFNPETGEVKRVPISTLWKYPAFRGVKSSSQKRSHTRPINP